MSTNPPDSTALYELRMIVHGRVQGVGYRMWARREAVRLGIAGSIRNLDDGTVEVLARGNAAALDRFHQLLGRGPLAAEVEGVSREPAERVPDSSFVIVG